MSYLVFWTMSCLRAVETRSIATFQLSYPLHRMKFVHSTLNPLSAFRTDYIEGLRIDSSKGAHLVSGIYGDWITAYNPVFVLVQPPHYIH